MWLCLSRDASCGPNTYSLMLIDCLHGIHKVCCFSIYMCCFVNSFKPVGQSISLFQEQAHKNTDRWGASRHIQRLLKYNRQILFYLFISLIHQQSYQTIAAKGIWHADGKARPTGTYSFPDKLSIHRYAQCLFRLLFLSIISTAYHLLSGSRATRLLLNWLIDWLTGITFPWQSKQDHFSNSKNTSHKPKTMQHKTTCLLIWSEKQRHSWKSQTEVAGWMEGVYREVTRFDKWKKFSFKGIIKFRLASEDSLVARSQACTRGVLLALLHSLGITDFCDTIWNRDCLFIHEFNVACYA